MKRALPLLLLGLAAFAQTGQQPKPLTNADVIEMWRAGVPASTIILAIQKTPLKFDVSAEGILALHAAGITESVLNQMLRAATPQKQSGPSFGVATGTFPVKDAAGKTVHFSAWIKTENVRNGYVGLWWRVDGPGEGTNRPRWLDTFGDRRATIFSFAMNNYWEDNYVRSQRGRFRFRYVVTSAPSTNEGQLSRLGWEEVTPLEIDSITSQDKALNQPQLLEGGQGSFAEIQDPNVLLDTWKPAEDHDGTILRFLDLGGQTRSMTVSVPSFRLLGAWQTDAVERNRDQLPIKDGNEFTVTIHPHEIVTVRVTTDGTGVVARGH